MSLNIKQLNNRSLVPMSEVQFLLTKLMSECNELAHAISKILEFGIDDVAHVDMVQYSGLQKVCEEYNDILGVAQMLIDIGLPIEAKRYLILAKKKKVEHYMLKARDIGTLSRERIVTPERLRKTRIAFQDMLNMSNVTITPESNWGSRPKFSIKHTRARLTLHLAAIPSLMTELQYAISMLYLFNPNLKFELCGGQDPETGRYEIHLKVVYNSLYADYQDSILDYWHSRSNELKHGYPEIQLRFDNTNPSIDD